MKKFTVWVGGSEVNDHYLDQQEAEELAMQFIDDDYDDVIIEAVTLDANGKRI